MARSIGWIVRGLAIAVFSIAIFWYIDRSFSDDASLPETIVIWFYIPALFAGFFLSGGVHGGSPSSYVAGTYAGVFAQNLILWVFAEWVWRRMRR